MGNNFDNIVLNIPHSSILGLFSEFGGWKYNANLLNKAIKDTDWHTDFIFHSDRDNVHSVVFNWCRYVVDVERLQNDPLEKEGRGIIYEGIDGFERNLKDKNRWMLMELRQRYLQHISHFINEKTLLLDCHSFNNDIAPDVDICIGYNEDWSKPDDETIKGICKIFTDAGYRVGLNRPYGNSLTPTTDCKYKSVMIEVNKKLYLRNGIEINVDTKYAPKLQNTIKKVYDFILE